jgi:hypothetical protein
VSVVIHDLGIWGLRRQTEFRTAGGLGCAFLVVSA